MLFLSSLLCWKKLRAPGRQKRFMLNLLGGQNRSRKRYDQIIDNVIDDVIDKILVFIKDNVMDSVLKIFLSKL